MSERLTPKPRIFDLTRDRQSARSISRRDSRRFIALLGWRGHEIRYSTFRSLTDHSLSRERPPRASVPDARRLAKHKGLQARASVRPLDGCSEKLGGVVALAPSGELVRRPR